MNDKKRLHVPRDPAKALRELNADRGGVKEPATKTDNETERDLPLRQTADGDDSRQKRNCRMVSLPLAVEMVAELDLYCRRYKRQRQEVLESALDLYFATMAEEQ